MGTGRRLVLGLILCAPCFAAGMREDTARLAARLASLRGSELTAAEFAPLQAEYLAWIDVRVRARATLKTINEELETAKLLLEQPKTFQIDDFQQSHAGYLDLVSVESVRQADDVFALSLVMYTGDYCDYDQTVVLYQRKPFRRLGWLNAEQSYGHGYYLQQLVLERANTSPGRFIASAWTASSCASVWNGGRFRIDLLQTRGITNVFNTYVLAKNDEAIYIDIQESGITFRYDTDMHDTIINRREGIASYKIENAKAVRQAPIASQFGGFIDEWLLLDDEDAARFSSTSAARVHHEIAAKFKKEPFDWQHAADCPGPAREIAVRGDGSEKTTVFLIASSSIGDMRMLSISDKPDPSCREIDILKDLSAITSGPSH
jgi:hypothetical protein